MKFRDLHRGESFRQVPKGTKHWDTVFIKLQATETTHVDKRGGCDRCKTVEVYNAGRMATQEEANTFGDSLVKVHFCPDNEVYPV